MKKWKRDILHREKARLQAEKVWAKKDPIGDAAVKAFMNAVAQGDSRAVRAGREKHQASKEQRKADIKETRRVARINAVIEGRRARIRLREMIIAARRDPCGAGK
jgi:hypothetical protein